MEKTEKVCETCYGGLRKQKGNGYCLTAQRIGKEKAALRYKRGPRFGLDEETQSWIYWKLQNYNRLPDREQRKIQRIVAESAEAAIDREAIFEALTTEKRLLDVALDHCREEKDLYYLIRRFFRKYATGKEQPGAEK